MSRQNLSVEKQRQRLTHQAMAYIVYKQNAKPRCWCYSTYRGAVSQSFLNSEGHASGAPAAPHPSAGGDLRPHTGSHCLQTFNDVSPCTYATGSAMTQERKQESLQGSSALGQHWDCVRESSGALEREHQDLFLITCSHKLHLLDDC